MVLNNSFRQRKRMIINYAISATRAEVLILLKRINLLTAVLSGFLFIFGLSAVLATAPGFEYPISIGGGAFFGITVRNYGYDTDVMAPFKFLYLFALL